MLPTFYQTLLQKYLTQSQLITLKMLVWLLQNQKQVRIERLAATLPLPIQQNSRRRHLQRFLNLDALSVVLLWFPLIEEILKRHFKLRAQLIIALDRTQWQENNVLMVSVIYQKRALPIFWVLLGKDGSSNLAEQQKVLRPVIRLLKKYKLVVVGEARISKHRTSKLATGNEYQLCITPETEHHVSPKKTLVSTVE